MTEFPFSSAFFARFLRVRALQWMIVATALAAVIAIPHSAHAARRVAGPYDGVWTTVFATTRGNCSSGYSVPFTVARGRVLSAGGGGGAGSIGRPRRGAAPRSLG